MIDEKTLITGGVGIGSGIFGAILTALGFKSRLDKVEKEYDEFKKNVVYKDVCEQCQKNQNNLVLSLKEDIVEVKGGMTRMDGKLDTLLLKQGVK
jgi:hypothetical protein